MDDPHLGHSRANSDPLTICRSQALDSLCLPSDDRAALRDYFDRTTWPSFFTSVAAMRDSLTAGAWPHADKKVLSFLGPVCQIGEVTYTEVAGVWRVDFDRLVDAFFPGRFPKEVREQSKFWLEEHDDPSQDGRGPDNDPGSVEEMAAIRQLLVARKKVLEYLRDNATKQRKVGRKPFSNVTLGEMTRVRDALNVEGWPGKYRSIHSYTTSSSPSGMPSHADCYSMYVIRSESHRRAIGLANLRGAFFPQVTDNVWTIACSAIKSMAQWSPKESDQLKKADQEGRLLEFTQMSGKTMYQAKHQLRILNPPPKGPGRRKRIASPESDISSIKKLKRAYAPLLMPTPPPSTAEEQDETSSSSTAHQMLGGPIGNARLQNQAHGTPLPAPIPALDMQGMWPSTEVPEDPRNYIAQPLTLLPPSLLNDWDFSEEGNSFSLNPITGQNVAIADPSNATPSSWNLHHVPATVGTVPHTTTDRANLPGVKFPQSAEGLPGASGLYEFPMNDPNIYDANLSTPEGHIYDAYSPGSYDARVHGHTDYGPLPSTSPSNSAPPADHFLAQQCPDTEYGQDSFDRALTHPHSPTPY